VALTPHVLAHALGKKPVPHDEVVPAE